MSKVNIIDASRKQWLAETITGTEYPGDMNIKLGCLQRIAAATELMAKNYDQLIRDRDWARAAEKRWADRAHKNDRRIAALKGQITKLKKAKA